MKLAVAGVMPDDYREIDAEFLRKIRNDGFHSVGCYEESLTALGAEGRKDFKSMLDGEGLGVHSWFIISETHIRPNHPDRGRDLDRFRLGAEIAHELGAESVGTSPGSFDPRHRWTAHPDNFAHRPLEYIADSFAEICPFFEDTGVKFGFEFGSAAVINTSERALWVLNAVKLAECFRLEIVESPRFKKLEESDTIQVTFEMD